ncbi:MAG: nucleotidyltransferase family protein [Patescibacteria group bacterium]|nr:nucleotidyltransferase family protein [Patescibacteria group bacterium]
MIAIILAAGYATRLYPLTLTTPKHLLVVAGRPIIDYVIDRLEEIQGISQIIVVTNEKFLPLFVAWHKEREESLLPLNVISDCSTDDTNKLGALGDIRFILDKEKIDDDIVVIAGDNLISGSFSDFGDVCAEKHAPVLGVYDVGDKNTAKKFGVVSVDEKGIISVFEEKPENPSGTLVATALYFYPRNILPLFREYLDEGNSQDQPGRFIQWLYTKVPVYAWRTPGAWYDIGSPETLKEAGEVFGKK